MYAMFVYMGPQWGWNFVGIDPHEECAVMFIDAVDRQYGDGTAQVFKFPSKADPSDNSIFFNAGHADLSDMLMDVEQGKRDFDEALKELNEKNKNNGR